MLWDIYNWFARIFKQNFCKHEYINTAGREWCWNSIEIMPQVRCRKCDRKIW